jgi:hypothetical protein
VDLKADCRSEFGAKETGELDGLLSHALTVGKIKSLYHPFVMAVRSEGRVSAVVKIGAIVSDEELCRAVELFAKQQRLALLFRFWSGRVKDDEPWLPSPAYLTHARQDAI